MRRLFGMMLPFCLTAGLASFSADAQTTTQTTKTPIYFDCKCDDAVGAQYATNLRDLLSSSPRYSLANEAVEKDSTGKITQFHWQIRVVSLDPTSNNSGRQTILSVVLLIGDFYGTQQVQWCPIAEVNGCAASTLSFVDGYITSLKQSN